MSRTPRPLPRVHRHIVQLARARAYLDRWAPLTFVHGLQGYGKTTLLVDWLRDQAASVGSVWVSAQRAGQGREAFTDALAEQLHRSDARWVARQPVRSESETSTPGDPAALLARAAAALAPGQRLVVVVDDAQHLDDRSLLLELVDVVARCEGLHLILCARGPHPVLDLAVGRVETVTVPPRELLLTAEEISRLADLMRVPLDAAQASALHSALGGWPAAVRLVLEQVDDPMRRLPLTRAEQYLREVVLPHVADTDTLREVMRLALAGRLTQELAQTLSGDRPHSNELVRLIEAQGLLERVYGEHDVELVFPAFIRAALRATLASTDPDGARDLHRRLARWFTAHAGPGHLLHALRHAVAAEDWEGLDEIWRDHSTELTLEHLGSLYDVIGSVPESVLWTRPSLFVAREMSRAATLSDPARKGRMAILRAYVDASRRVAAGGLDRMPLHDLVYVGTGQLVGLRLDGRLADSERVARQIHAAVLARGAKGEDPGDRLAWFHLQRGLTQTLHARHRAAAESYRLCWTYRRVTYPHVAATAAANLALTHALAAEHTEARQWLERHQRTGVTGPWKQVLDVGARTARALVALDELRTELSRAELMQLDEGSAQVELWSLVTFVHAQFGLHAGEAAATLARLDAAHRATPSAQASGATARMLLTRARADLLLATGQGHHARSLLESAHAETVPLLATPLARLALLAGQPYEACRIAANLLWRDTLDNRSRLELLLVKALAAHRIGDLDVSADMTRRATSLGVQTRLLRAFTTVSSGDLETLFHNAGDALPPELLARVNDQRRPFPERIQLVELTRRERLLVQALGSDASRQEIADAFYVSVNTVRSQLATLYRKLQVTTREEALAKLAQLGLTPGPQPFRQAPPTPEPTSGIAGQGQACPDHEHRLG